MDASSGHETESTALHRVWKLVAIWFVLALAFGLLLGYLLLRRDYRLLADGVPTTGRVLSLEEMNHQRVDYSYRVGDRDYSGSGVGGEGIPPFNALEVGAPVLVYYSEAELHLSALGQPAHRFWNDLVPILLAAVTIPAVLVSEFIRLMKRKRGIRS